MGYHIGITSTGGLTLAAGVIPQSVDESSKVGVSEVIGATGEIVKSDSLRTKQVDLSISGVGAAPFASVTAADVPSPATMKILRCSQDETSTGDLRAKFSLSATSMVAFTDDGEGAGEGAGEAGPDADTLGIVSATFSLMESLNRSTEVKDVNVPATNGAPGARATCTKKNSTSARGRGDLPANITLGLAGMGVFGFTGGKLHVTQLDAGQKADDINSWGASASHYPAAA